MAIATPVTNIRPMIAAVGQSWYKRINWSWWLQRLPMALLAAPSAYGVGAFASDHLPVYVAIIAGLAFEAAYMGAVALADQQHELNDKTTTFLWFMVNLIAVGASALSNILFFSGGTYAGVTPESITHGLPLAVLNFFYGLLLHRMSVKAAASASTELEQQRAETERLQRKAEAEADEQREREREEADAQRQREQEQELRETFKCICGAGFTSEPALRGHKGRCKMYKAQLGASSTSASASSTIARP